MKINQSIKIVGDNVVLVPYREIHVLKYHNWMSSSELQKLTASEPLSLENEYEMQKSWANDEDKCTFIVLDKQLYLDTGDEVGSMIGDVNLFLLAPDEEECQEELESSQINKEKPQAAEIEIMIAESLFRRQGRGREATWIMLKYGIEELGIVRFEAKIGLDNAASIDMFQRRLGFSEVSRSEIFSEVTLAAYASDLLKDQGLFHYELSRQLQS